MYVKQSQLIPYLLHTPQLSQLSETNRKFVIALRITMLAAQRKIKIYGYLRKYFDCARASKSFLHIIETIDDIWPEKFHVQAACCPTISYDELLMIDLMDAAMHKRIMHFHGLLCEMLSKTQSERLHHNIEQLIAHIHDKKVLP